jgi:hypothetical protein
MLAPQLVDPGTLAPAQRTPREGRGREAMIRKAAHLLAQWRGLVPGPEPEDWRTAERQIDELLRVCGAALECRARAPARALTDTLRSQSART